MPRAISAVRERAGAAEAAADNGARRWPDLRLVVDICPLRHPPYDTGRDMGANFGQSGLEIALRTPIPPRPDMKLDEAALAAIRADPRVIWSEDVIRYADIDANDHVNNTTFSVLCESGRVNMFRTQFGDGPRTGFYFIVARLAIDYLAELRYPGRARTGTWVARVGRTSIGVGQVLLGEDGRAAALSECVSVTMDSATRRPTPLPDALRAKAEALLRA
jgi:acyl-CoA thioester hydrolase